MNHDWLHELAGRLCDRGEPDAAELIAHQAGFDHQLLFAASDAALERSMHRRDDEDWRQRGRVLSDAAVVSLRQHGGTEPSRPRGLVTSELPRVPYVTVDLGYVIRRADRLGDSEDLPIVRAMMETVVQALMVAGEPGEKSAFLRTLRAAMESGEFDTEKMLRMTANFVSLRHLED